MPELEQEILAKPDADHEGGASDTVVNAGGSVSYSSTIEVVSKDASQEQKATYDFVVATSSIDRANHILDLNGGDFKKYLANPVVLWQHNRTWGVRPMPIAKCIDLRIEGKKLMATVQFHGETKESREAEALVKGGYIKAASISFIPLASTVEKLAEDDARRKQLYPSWEEGTIRTFTKWQMTEFSLVDIPMNPEAVRKSYSENIQKAIDDNVIAGDSAIVKSLELSPVEHVEATFHTCLPLLKEVGQETREIGKEGRVLSSASLAKLNKVREQLSLATDSLDSVISSAKPESKDAENAGICKTEIQLMFKELDSISQVLSSLQDVQEPEDDTATARLLAKALEEMNSKDASTSLEEQLNTELNKLNS